MLLAPSLLVTCVYTKQQYEKEDSSTAPHSTRWVVCFGCLFFLPGRLAFGWPPLSRVITSHKSCSMHVFCIHILDLSGTQPFHFRFADGFLNTLSTSLFGVCLRFLVSICAAGWSESVVCAFSSCATEIQPGLDSLPFFHIESRQKRQRDTWLQRK